MPLYAHYGVAHVWLVDPWAKGLEAFALAENGWLLVATLKDEDAVAVPPFEAVSFSLPDLQDVSANVISAWMPQSLALDGNGLLTQMFDLKQGRLGCGSIATQLHPGNVGLPKRRQPNLRDYALGDVWRQVAAQKTFHYLASGKRFRGKSGHGGR
jgi:hypothetical protein